MLPTVGGNDTLGRTTEEVHIDVELARPAEADVIVTTSLWEEKTCTELLWMATK